ncbi:8715_t:CDS:2 [Paraglomus brasilianum]|uniref:8715_t:CDS:1 n=1 Tax=Paraglomus brasilianum TaxID=144538 RepID=A0A9N9DJQ6_9GLOM|nr:8715_t:CDS:2 [Paraglomus brasilianum]
MSITSKGELVTDHQYQTPSHHVPTSNPPESHVRPSIVAAEQSDSIDIISKLGTICLYSRMMYPMVVELKLTGSMWGKNLDGQKKGQSHMWENITQHASIPRAHLFHLGTFGSTDKFKDCFYSFYCVAKTTRCNANKSILKFVAVTPAGTVGIYPAIWGPHQEVEDPRIPPIPE